MSTEESVEQKPKRRPMSLRDNPIPWLGAIGTIATFAVTTSFNWALGVQEKMLTHEARLAVMEENSKGIKKDLEDIKTNVLFLRFGKETK